MLKESFLPRLLKKVQMPLDFARDGARGTQPEAGTPQMGLFQQPDRSGRPPAFGRGAVALGVVLACLALPLPASPAEVLENVALNIVSREILFFSAPFGVWTSIRLDAGEQVLQHGADGNTAVVVTSSRTIGFSAPLNAVDQLRLPQDEGVEKFQVGGNLATVVTRQRALGFSALTGKWHAVDRFYLGR